MNNKIAGYPSQELKSEISHLAESRENIQRGKNISDSMVELNKTLGNIDPLLKKQGEYIKNFFNQPNSGGAKQKESEARRSINRICEITIQQINGFFDVGQEYFKLDVKNSWSKISTGFQKQLQTLREQTDHKNIVEFLFKIMNLKDYIINSLFKSLIYRKSLLFKDLNIIEDGFVHTQKKVITKQIEDYMCEKGYIPTKPIFQWIGFQVGGQWNMNKLIENSQVSLKDLLKIANQQLEDVFSVIRNYSHLTPQQREHDDIKRNGQNIKSLRQQIEDSKIAYALLQKKYRETSVRDEKPGDSAELRQKVTKLEETLEEKENQLKILKFEFRDSSNQINSLREKNRQLESDNKRINNIEMKKLRELETVQKSLSDQFTRIYKNTNNFGAMFEFQSHGKKSLAKQIMSREQTIQKLVDILGRQKNKKRLLESQIVRLNIIILQLGDKFDRARSSIDT